MLILVNVFCIKNVNTTMVLIIAVIPAAATALASVYVVAKSY